MKLNRLKISSSIAVNLVVAACVLGLIFIASIALFRENLSVSVDKMAPTVAIKRTQATIDEKDISKPICTNAGVNWSFNCENEMQYSYVERAKLGDRWSVTIRIQEVSMRLSLPITTTLPAKPPLRLEQHNEGHVLICRRIYDDAEQYAKEAIYPVFKRTYTADGDTLDEASAKAVGIANSEVIEAYHQQTQQAAQALSNIYELLELSRPPSYEHSLEKTFNAYHSGQRRRI